MHIYKELQFLPANLSPVLCLEAIPGDGIRKKEGPDRAGDEGRAGRLPAANRYGPPNNSPSETMAAAPVTGTAAIHFVICYAPDGSGSSGLLNIPPQASVIAIRATQKL